jgi:hypothetical protein
MKKYINIIIGLLLLIFFTSTIFLIKNYKSLEDKYLSSKNNEKALLAEYNEVVEDNYLYKITVEQLVEYSDSINRKLLNTLELLDIAKEEVIQMQYIQSSLSRLDTIIIKDTIFRDSIRIDTVIGDNWYNVQLGLYYPNTIIINPTVISEKHIIMSTEKVTIDPPKKFFLCRWFQKKHTVVNIEVVEKNPYIQTEKNRFIEIIN